MGKRSPFEVAKEVLKTKYPEAAVGFVGGSFNRNEETQFSDIDLVVVYSKLKSAWRESFYHSGWPVEAFVHDPETLLYFFNEVDGKDGTPLLPMMVLEGPCIPSESELGKDLKNRAQQMIDIGPPEWGKDVIYHNLYMITDLIDDIRDPRDGIEANAVLGSLHETLGNFYFRANGKWSASRKHIPRKLKQIDPVLYENWVTAFSEAYGGNFDKVIQLATLITKPFGGLLFDGYRRDAPENWRFNRSEESTKASVSSTPVSRAENPKIRPLALALIKNQRGQYLFHKGYDKVKNEYFYRPLGGGIEFSESGKIAVEREIMEELNQRVHVGDLLTSFENIFTFEGRRGHEVIMLYEASFISASVYKLPELDIYESGEVVAKAVWRSVEDIKSENAKIYPVGLERVLLEHQ